jgi:hypothetical protein
VGEFLIIYFKLAIGLAAALLLVGCNKAHESEQFLLTHPHELQQAIKKCRDHSEESARCRQVNAALDKFLLIIKKRVQNPEMFGQTILDAETKLVDARLALQKARLALQDAKDKHADDIALKETQKIVEERRQAYRNQKQEVKELLAVVAATSSPGL